MKLCKKCQRKLDILELLRKKKYYNRKLALMLGISPSLIFLYLNQLKKEGLIREIRNNDLPPNLKLYELEKRHSA